MRAISIEHFGETPALRQVPVPEPGSGEVQVAIEAASTNPLDRAIASGALAEIGEYRFPLTLGMDGAGTVIATGDHVTEFRVGERVFGQFWSRPLRSGTFAGVAVVQAIPVFGALGRVPGGLPSEVAAALPTAGMTALGAIDAMRVPEGGTLVVLGATGGVGTFAVQAAAARGIRVIATASAQVAEEVRELGATEIVERGAEPLDRALRGLAPDGVDAVLDAVGDRSLTSGAAGALRGGGALLSIAFGVGEGLLADERIRASEYRLDRKPERLAELATLVAAGTIRPVIGAMLPLEEAPRALTSGIEPTGMRGKTVLRVR